uniref:Uncharacterized protein n=1 Tax=Utricularia reniformis TaxID=192314 RepID=A0A1Y0B0A2_9LAMI|nr:hypothetical protein AEK19_MT0600 [Utricularia reniformis]ART30855.1 hypothetical protein AEK19_MT0600 [Utricularia reniformis]
MYLEALLHCGFSVMEDSQFISSSPAKGFEEFLRRVRSPFFKEECHHRGISMYTSWSLSIALL